MNSTQEITFHLNGVVDNEKLSPQNYDISMQYEILGYANKLLRADKKDTSIITRRVENGSVKEIFVTSTETAFKFGAILTLVANTPSNGELTLDYKSAKIFEDLQQYVRKNDLTLEISTNINDVLVNITPQTNYHINTTIWVSAEKYYYGKIVNAGGKQDANIHLDTKYGNFIIKSSEETLRQIEHPLYNNFAVRVKVKQNPTTGEIDPNSMELIELINYNPKFNKAYLEDLQTKATKTWRNVNVEEYLQEVRGI